MVKKDWLEQKTLTCGDLNIVNQPTVSRERIIFPPFHIKLAFMEQCGRCLFFSHIREVLPAVSYEKIRVGIFYGLKIQQPIRNKSMEETINATKKRDWVALKDVVTQFLGNKRGDDYR